MEELRRAAARGGGGEELRRAAARGGGGAAGSSRTGGEVGSSFCGSNAVTAAPVLRVDDDIDDAALPLPGASTSGRSGSSALLKRARDEFDSRSEDADFEAVDETRPSRQPSSKCRTRSAEVHNLLERRRRDRINEKMRALQELVPHCNKVLAVQEKSGVLRGLGVWKFPTGVVEPGKDINIGAVRKVKEETGVFINIKR